MGNAQGAGEIPLGVDVDGNLHVVAKLVANQFDRIQRTV